MFIAGAGARSGKPHVAVSGQIQLSRRPWDCVLVSRWGWYKNVRCLKHTYVVCWDRLSLVTVCCNFNGKLHYRRNRCVSPHPLIIFVDVVVFLRTYNGLRTI